MQIDIIPTTGCTCDCVECYLPAANDLMDFSVRHKAIATIEEMLDDPRLDGELVLSMVGGEPTVNTNAIENIINRFENNDRVRFEVVTTGHRVTSKSITMIKSSRKCTVKVAYDGLAISKEWRGHGVDHQLRFIEEMKEAGVEVEIESYVPQGMSKHMHAAYEEMKGLGCTYAPKFDHLGTEFKESALDQHAMERILSDELSSSVPSFAPFFAEVQACKAGADRISISPSGAVTKCHGCNWAKNSSDHVIGTSLTDESIDKIFGSLQFHSGIAAPAQCAGCDVEYCVKCHVSAYDATAGMNYQDRWTAFDKQPACDMYRQLHSYRKKYERVKALYEKDNRW